MATLEQTLEQMIESNMAYSRSYKPVNEKRAFAERAKLREQLDKVYDRLKFKRQEERGVMGDVAQAEARVAQLQEEEADLRHMVDEVERRQAEAQAAVQVCCCIVFLPADAMLEWTGVASANLGLISAGRDGCNA